jgi:maltose O-acetyltransferase
MSVINCIRNVSKDFMGIFFNWQHRIRVYSRKVGNNLVIGKRVRIVTLSRFKVGKNVGIADGVILDCGGNIWGELRGGITIGNNSYIGYNSVLLGGGEIEIGKKVLISPGTVVTTQGHLFKDTGRYMKDQPTYVAKVIIEDDVWIGANATILPGVRVGKGSVIGAGSVVTNDIPEYSIAVGIPARVISKRG